MSEGDKQVEETKEELETTQPGMEGITFIEPDPNKKMTSAKRKRVEKAKQKVNLMKRRKTLFEEISKLMLTEEELPNLRSTTKLGLEMDEDNKEDIVIMPKKMKAKEEEKKPKVKVEDVKDNVAKILVEDGKKTFGFGFINDKLKFVDNAEEMEDEKPQMGKVLFVNNDKMSDDEDDENENEEENEVSEENNETNDNETNENEDESEDEIVHDGERVRTIIRKLDDEAEEEEVEDVRE